MGLEEHFKHSTVIADDNQQAMTLGLEPKVTEGNKFYLLDLHFCKDEEGHAQYRWVLGENNHADIMTKPLGTGCSTGLWHRAADTRSLRLRCWHHHCWVGRRREFFLGGRVFAIS
jgi:hypothetical protein